MLDSLEDHRGVRQQQSHADKFFRDQRGRWPASPRAATNSGG